MSKGSKRRPGTITDEQWARTFGTKRVNQCDGCRRGLPLEGGIHRGPTAWDVIGCTAARYDINLDIATAEPAVSSDPAET